MSAVRTQQLRAAALAAVHAFFDALEAQERDAPRRTVVRPPAAPDAEASELDRARASAILARHGGTR